MLDCTRTGTAEHANPRFDSPPLFRGRFHHPFSAVRLHDFAEHKQLGVLIVMIDEMSADISVFGAAVGLQNESQAHRRRHSQSR